MNYSEIIEDAGRFVSHFMDEHRGKNLSYHGIDHTKSVVGSAIQIANHYQLNDLDFFVVVVAAWFHDTGYFNGPGINHEERGVVLATEFMGKNRVDAAVQAGVGRCILATKMPQNPSGLLEEIVCDADLSHFGTEEFSRNNKLLHKEVEITQNKHISKEEWRRQTLVLLEQHHYFTDYCRLLLNDKKQENVEKLKKKLHTPPAIQPAQAGSQPEQGINPNREKNNPGRGIETMFRITSGNNQRLSDMADNKAHILITVNSIILSAIISLLLRRLEDSQFLTYPTFALMAVSVLTIVIAIIATRPSIPKGIFTQQDIEDKKVNLLFFGNFYRMTLEDYSAGMRKVMRDSDFLYGSLIKDVYAQGVVLGRKYRYLRASYNIFMYGLIISVLWFAVVSILYSK
ncbi:MAG TPA: Pycsar system effector family protein [Flavitalea sp.]|nr:Pycsar system effector family protein [Flavitalea sp.]